ncbi:MAG: DEAD/DEAH box helicase [Promicromonosporaceae bacterium]|nr:DEAD/DEAH box helicase [Promicromonosporaceae bacterium]
MMEEQPNQPESSAEEQPLGFARLGLAPELLQAVVDLGYTEPTPIQLRAIPPLLEGRDLTGIAQTGTGKTAAFGLPLLAEVHPDVKRVQAIVLTPTRELAIQVSEAIAGFAVQIPQIRVLAVYGGAPYMPQQRALAEGVQVVVGTPGRVMDHMERGNLDLSHVRFVVLDEADEMLRMGFAEDVETIFAGFGDTKPQVALFSATMPPAIRAVADSHTYNPVHIAVTPQATTVDSVTQKYAIVPYRHKIGALVRVLETTEADATIVFCRTKAAAEEVGAAIIAKGISAATISGDVPQKERERIVERLRNGTLDVLVATDVAARGLDVDRVGLVVNFDIPREPEAYVHRIGRTGRAGRSGEAISFVTPSERSRLRQIEKTTKVPIAEFEIPSPKDVSAYKARNFLMQVPDRRRAGRLEMYQNLVREQLLTGSDYNVIDPERAIEMAAALLALAVGDDGPRAQAEQEEFEAERAQGTRRAALDLADAKRRSSEVSDRRGRATGAYRDRSGARTATRYRVAVGHKDGVTPAAIVGALTGESGLRGSDIGKIDIFPSFSLVEIETELTPDELRKLGRAVVAGRALRITEDQGPRSDRDRGPKKAFRKEKPKAGKGFGKRSRW